jgi:hypothetical protein
VRLLAPFIACLLLTGCADTITAPEATSLVSAFERARGAYAGTSEERLWQRMGYQLELATQQRAKRVEVRWDLYTRRYSALVIERVMLRSWDDPPGTCAGPELSLALWTGGERPTGMVLSGHRFERPLGEPATCLSVGSRIEMPDPILLAYPSEDDAVDLNWRGVSGTGYISPGRVLGDCDFLSPEAVTALAEGYAITCTRTEHEVEFDATLRRYAPTTVAPREPGAVAGLPRSARLPPTTVQGIRYTIDCMRDVPVDLCGRSLPRWRPASP